MWEVDGFEGDDLIATATNLITGHGCHSVLIASADKDLLALVSERVEVHSIRTGKRLGPDEVEEKLGVRPYLVVDYLTLVGDASDNIKGAKGIGPKTAAGIIDYFGSVDEVYAAIDVGSASNLKPAQLASLEELRPRLEAVRSLVRMRDGRAAGRGGGVQAASAEGSRDFYGGRRNGKRQKIDAFQMPSAAEA